MEIVEKPQVAKKRAGEAPLERRTRLRGGYREPRLYGFRRIPRNLGGGVLGMIVLLLFWAGMFDYSWDFFLGIAIAVGATALLVWALILSPVRGSFDQRWRPKRKIEPLDTTAWRELAERLGAKFSMRRLPAIEGAMDGIAFRLAFKRLGGARTVASAVLPFPVRKRFRAFPRLTRFATRQDHLTGDEAFDARWHVTCADRRAAERLLSPGAREWIDAADPTEVGAKGRAAGARRRGFVTDTDLLYGLVRTVVEMASG